MRAVPRVASASVSETGLNDCEPVRRAVGSSSQAVGHIGRIVQSADFERVLRCPPRAKTQHFALHHLAEMPSRPAAPKSASSTELSTRLATVDSSAVDESRAPKPAVTPPQGCWLGLVVPKRHARRAVTRNLLKRGIRAAVSCHAEQLERGLWVVRLRAPFDKATFPSAASNPLHAAAGLELAQALRQACEPVSAARTQRAGGRHA